MKRIHVNRERQISVKLTVLGVDLSIGGTLGAGGPSGFDVSEGKVCLREELLVILALLCDALYP